MSEAPELDTGLRGVVVGTCPTSTVKPQEGLFYGKLPVSEMTEWEPERVIYSLFYRKDPSVTELQAFKKTLQARSHCSKGLIAAIEKLPRDVHPMRLLEMALLLGTRYEGANDYTEDALNVVAKIPEMSARVIHHHAGWGVCQPSDPSLGYVDNFLHMLTPKKPFPRKLLHVMKLFNILHYDHGGGNLSTFVGKGVASGGEDMWGSLAASMCALEGNKHGRANQEALEFVEKALQEIGEHPTFEKVSAWIRSILTNNGLVYGFGHAVLRVEDPRATIFYKTAQTHFSQDRMVQMAVLIREAAPPILKENPKIADPYPNVDAISGTLLSAAGFPYPEYYTVLFGMSRVVGIGAQIVYERTLARGGKGVPIYRPSYKFVELA